jgi:hypothetical protein
MKKNKWLLWLCVMALVASLMTGCISRQPDEKPTDPTVVTDSTDDQTNDENNIPDKDGDTDVKPDNDQPDDQPDNQQDDPVKGEDPPAQNTTTVTGVTFPYQIPGYDLTVEKIAAYKGTFVETGTNVTVENVAMLLVRNQGTLPVEFARITVQCGEEQLNFEVSALPAGERLVVQEKTGKPMPAEDISSVTAVVAYRDAMDMSESMVQVTDNGDNTLTVKNLTEETIATVRVFYKYYMAAEDTYVGGIAFAVRITRLNAGASITVQPAHYTSENCRVVMATTYDSEV